MSNYKLKQTFGNIFHFVIYMYSIQNQRQEGINNKKVFLKKSADDNGNHQFLFYFIIQSSKIIRKYTFTYDGVTWKHPGGQVFIQALKILIAKQKISHNNDIINKIIPFV